MPEVWKYTDVNRSEWGTLQVVIGGKDVTYFRSAPTLVSSWSSADPFGDAAASIVLPQVTSFDALGAGDLWWLHDWSDVDIYRVDPSSNRTKLWEGFVASFDHDAPGLTISCLGALYQLDLYVAPPRFFNERRRIERIFRDNLPPRTDREHLRLGNLRITFPAGWDIQDSKGRNVTGHWTMNSGSWDRVLTGYFQDLLTMMLTREGRQWTLMKNNGRRPVLRLKNNAPSWTLDASAPGVEVSLSRDLTQMVNVVYGQGQDIAGTTWRNATINREGTFTDYEPVAFDLSVHPDERDNRAFDEDSVRVESFYNFGNGVTLIDALDEGGRIITRDRDPGWAGTIMLETDPDEGSRFLIKAGDVLNLRYFAGHRRDGLDLHIAEAQIDAEQGQVALTVDSKARDLLTLSEILARQRDAKTPSRLLQVNRGSQIIEDRFQPWDYDAGSGYIPTGAKDMGIEDETFPWTSKASTPGIRPKDNDDFYVFVNGASGDLKERWAIFPVVMSERINIRAIEIASFNENGVVTPSRFHVGIYDQRVWPEDMPIEGGVGPHPFFDGAFDSTSANVLHHPHPAIIIGWGNNAQPAGYFPGLFSEGDPATGKFKDEGSWQHTMPQGHYIAWMAIYCEQNLWFLGRMYAGTD